MIPGRLEEQAANSFQGDLVFKVHVVGMDPDLLSPNSRLLFWGHGWTNCPRLGREACAF
jgi:hypothetical protein